MADVCAGVGAMVGGIVNLIRKRHARASFPMKGETK